MVLLYVAGVPAVPSEDILETERRDAADHEFLRDAAPDAAGSSCDDGLRGLSSSAASARATAADPRCASRVATIGCCINQSVDEEMLHMAMPHITLGCCINQSVDEEVRHIAPPRITLGCCAISNLDNVAPSLELQSSAVVGAVDRCPVVVRIEEAALLAVLPDRNDDHVLPLRINEEGVHWPLSAEAVHIAELTEVLRKIAFELEGTAFDPEAVEGDGSVIIRGNFRCGDGISSVQGQLAAEVQKLAVASLGIIDSRLDETTKGVLEPSAGRLMLADEHRRKLSMCARAVATLSETVVSVPEPRHREPQLLVEDNLGAEAHGPGESPGAAAGAASAEPERRGAWPQRWLRPLQANRSARAPRAPVRRSPRSLQTTPELEEIAGEPQLCACAGLRLSPSRPGSSSDEVPRWQLPRHGRARSLLTAAGRGPFAGQGEQTSLSTTRLETRSSPQGCGASGGWTSLPEIRTTLTRRRGNRPRRRRAPRQKPGRWSSP